MDGGEIENIKRWIVFYPIYINSKKTVAEGRRISLANACENPTFTEIADCCAHLKLPNAIELDKAYPRDFMQRGRVRVLLKREDGTLCNPAISSRCWPSISAGGDLKMFYDGRNTKDSCLEVVYRMYWLCYHIHTYKKTQLVEILINKVETSVRFPPTLRAFTCSVSAWLKSRG
ncbi:signal recognition particle 19 kDa protein-like isoform X2 [Corylus avellana]|uniref:signal recognition particle 19 kDa protein-like isoform X2 n=1 Tax=Corylus avellana TaxID=13451 RepID=UPI00286AFE86|nr:signal recognition particle 19 kDa protein-like isoform X2 [Corylus avellana]